MAVVLQGEVTIDVRRTGGDVVVTARWKADAAGGVRAHLDEVVAGVLHTHTTKPDPVAPPADLYDAEWLDELGRDVLGGAGQNRSNAAIQEVPLYVADASVATPRDVRSRLVFRVTGAGNGGSGVAVLALKHQAPGIVRL